MIPMQNNVKIKLIDNSVSESGIIYFGDKRGILMDEGIVEKVGKGTSKEKMLLNEGDKVMYDPNGLYDYNGEYLINQEHILYNSTRNEVPVNLVLVKIKDSNDQIDIKDGGKLYIDPTYNEWKHSVRVGEVIACPRILKNMEWETKIQCKAGDKIYFSPIEYANAEKRGYKFIKEGCTYIFVKYSLCFMSVRNGFDEPIMLNGYNLLSAEKSEEESVTKTGIILLPKEEDRTRLKLCSIEYTGERNTSYNKHPAFPNGDSYLIKKGLKVYIEKNADILLEDPMHQTFDKGKELYRVQSKHIAVIKDGENLVPLCGRMVCRLLPPDTKEAKGIIIPDNFYKSDKAEVLVIGDDIRECSVGDIILCSTSDGVVITHNGEDLLVVREQLILGKFK